MVHMIMMSTEHDYRPGSPQYVWIENDLKNVDRTKTPFVMIGGHRPMYCSESVYGNANTILQKLIFRIVKKLQLIYHYRKKYEFFEEKS